MTTRRRASERMYRSSPSTERTIHSLGKAGGGRRDRPMGDLRRAMALLELEPRRVLVAVAAGVATLGAALLLSGLSAWLIIRAWQMPPVLDLTVAVVAVRALGISRGLFRYCERLATHDVALRGTIAARAGLYRRLAAGDPAIAGTAYNDKFTFVEAGAFTGKAGQLISVEDTPGHFLVQGDVNGDAQADFSFWVDSPAPLNASCFML